MTVLPVLGHCSSVLHEASKPLLQHCLFLAEFVQSRELRRFTLAAREVDARAKRPAVMVASWNMANSQENKRKRN